MSQENVEVVRAAMDAFNRRDLLRDGCGSLTGQRWLQSRDAMVAMAPVGVASVAGGFGAVGPDHSPMGLGGGRRGIGHLSCQSPLAAGPASWRRFEAG
jgi:hypothetical protein